ncbi:MAG: hypothetical protein JRJ66_02130 [Deltaproteobacteria bacterium]|nr:hypothetical protein [Deltaproteobacteria bacterium]
MPIPKPQGNEKRDNFLQRCMADGIMVSEYPDEKQRYAICIRQWEEAMKFKGFDDWIEIFRGGKQTDSEGREHDGDQLIEKAVATFDPRAHEPPLVIGHPRENAPAYGWVEGLATTVRDGVKVLLARFKQVVPEFAQMVEQGLFKKRSASFYPDGRLRHVGFLGAAPPAVKGLQDIGFKEEGIVFEFASREEAREAQEKRSKRYGIGIKEGGHVSKPAEWKDVPDEQFLDPVNYRYPCPSADQTRAAASYWGQKDNQAQYTPEERSIISERLDKFRKKFGIGQFKKNNFTGGSQMEKFMEFLEFLKFWKKIEKDPDLGFGDNKDKGFSEADLERAKQEAAEAAKREAEAAFAEEQKKARKAARDREIAGFVDGIIKEGRIPPAWKDAGLVQFMQALDGESEIQFSEEKKQSKLEWFKEFLGGFGKPDLFKEIATKEKAGDSGQFAEAEADAKLGKKIAAKVSPAAQK